MSVDGWGIQARLTGGTVVHDRVARTRIDLSPTELMLLGSGLFREISQRGPESEPKLLTN